MNYQKIKPILVGTGLFALAAFSLWQLWDYTMHSPWTRDGRVRTEVVQVAPDVSGIITDVSIRDNQHVTAGTPLFTIDRARYEIALAQAQAKLEQTKALLQQAKSDEARYHAADKQSVAAIEREQSSAKSDTTAAEYKLAQANVNAAKLDLERTVVRAPLDGTITNTDLRPGGYIHAGQPVLALVADNSYYVMGYFEETKIQHIHLNDPVDIHLMGVSQILHGHVEGIASGIVDRERTESPNLLANVNPAFSWVRLAQRIPVRIVFDDTPSDVRIIAGQTATVYVKPHA